MTLTNAVFTDSLYQSGNQDASSTAFESDAIRVSQYSSVSILLNMVADGHIAVYRLDSSDRRYELLASTAEAAGAHQIDIGPGLSVGVAIGRRIVVKMVDGKGSFSVEGTAGSLGGAQALSATTLAASGDSELQNLDVEGTLNADGNTTLGGTLAVTGGLGVNGVTPAAQAAAITPPAEQGVGYVQADVESLGTAIDAIIVALHNVGITA